MFLTRVACPAFLRSLQLLREWVLLLLLLLVLQHSWLGLLHQQGCC